MYTKKSNQNSDYRITSSVDTTTKPIDDNGLNVSIRYATINTSVTILIVLFVTQLMGISLITSFMIASVTGLGLFLVTFNKGISLARIESIFHNANYDNEQETLQQALALPQSHKVEITHIEDNGTQYPKWIHDTLDIELETLQALSVALMNGKAFNRVTCQEVGISQTQWPNFKDKMIERGYIVAKGNGKNQGYVTTTKGNATFRHLANYSPTLAIGDGNE